MGKTAPFQAPCLDFKSDTLILSSKETADFLKSACNKGVAFKFTAKGLSMSPFIYNGDALIIEPVSKKELETGDIVAFTTQEEGKLIIHRIIKKKNCHYLLKGDNVYYNDGYYKKESIHGYVKTIIIRKKLYGCRKMFHIFCLYLNNFKKTMAFFSRHKILTVACRVFNKVLDEQSC